MAGVLRSLGGSLRNVWSAYEHQLHTQPMRTQAITSGALWWGLRPPCKLHVLLCTCCATMHDAEYALIQWALQVGSIGLCT